MALANLNLPSFCEAENSRNKDVEYSGNVFHSARNKARCYMI